MQHPEHYLHTHIPISQAMGVRVDTANDNLVTLTAPLKPNINHSETVFGGSAAAVATLAAWTLIMFRMKSQELPGRLVIAGNTMKYRKPITGDFRATATAADLSDWARFGEALARKGRGRIEARSRLFLDRTPVADFTGQFVAIVD